MSTFARICFSLAVFLGVAGLVYGFTSHEPAGTTALLVSATTFGFLGLVTRAVAAHATGPEAEEAEEVEVHVNPTIWPFGFAVAAVIIALGLIVTQWLLIAGAIAFALSAAGWLREVSRGSSTSR